MTGRSQASRLQRLTDAITERDQQLLAEIERLRLVTGGQLARLFFAASPSAASGARACRKQLSRLSELGVVEALPRPVGGVRGGSRGTIWRITSEGRRLNAWRRGEPLPARRSRYVAGSGHQRHTLGLAELSVRLCEADRAGRLELLEHQAEPACWRSFVASYGGLGQLKPDAFVRLGVGEWEQLAFVELDRGTEGSSALERKVEAYLAYGRSGAEQQQYGVFPQVVWLTATERRQAPLQQLLPRAATSGEVTFIVGAASDAITVLAGATA